MVDIVDIKTAVKKGEIAFYVDQGGIYAKNDAKEVVCVDKIEGYIGLVEEINAQYCLCRLCDALLGPGRYDFNPFGINQVNEIVTQKILEKYKKVGLNDEKRV